ncbi:MAG: metallophosphoesterase family protein [Nocardioidaceae bacterium]
MGSLFVVSDVHGYRDDLHEGLIEAGLADADGKWTGGDDQLWVLGDLTDRGPDGIGAVDLVMSLQQQAPDRVHVLMGNHEALALGMHRFPESRFAGAWFVNGGKLRDQEALTDEHVEWLASLPVIGRAGDFLMMHSDTTAYLAWGESVEEINETVRALLQPGDVPAHWDVFAKLTSRYHFARQDGREVAAGFLETLGGDCVVHGHSIIGSLVDVPSEEVDAPILYADGLVLAVDGGRYDGGPLLVVRLDQVLD